MTTRTLEKMAAAILATRTPGKPKDEWALEAARNVAEVLRQGGDEIDANFNSLSSIQNYNPPDWIWESTLATILGERGE